MTATARHGKISNRRCALIAMHAKQDLLTASGVNGKICLQLTYAPLYSLFSHTLLVAGQRGTIVHVTPENSTVDISMYCHTIDVFIFLGFKYVIKLPFTFVSNECVLLLSWCVHIHILLKLIAWSGICSKIQNGTKTPQEISEYSKQIVTII